MPSAARHSLGTANWWITSIVMNCAEGVWRCGDRHFNRKIWSAS